MVQPGGISGVCTNKIQGAYLPCCSITKIARKTIRAARRTSRATRAPPSPQHPSGTNGLLGQRSVQGLSPRLGGRGAPGEPDGAEMACWVPVASLEAIPGPNKG